MGFNSAFKELKLFKKNPGNGRLNNLNDPVLNVLIMWVQFVCLWHTYNAIFCYAVANNGQLSATGILWTSLLPPESLHNAPI